MPKKIGLNVLLAVALLISHSAMAKSNSADLKVADDFQKQASALSATVANLNTMQTEASPHDAELLGLINNQMGLVSVNVDGIVALSQLSAQMRDSRDLKLTHKYLAAHCEVLLPLVNQSVTYARSVAHGVAAVAINAEIERVSEIASGIGGHPVCTDKKFNPLNRGL